MEYLFESLCLFSPFTTCFIVHTCPFIYTTQVTYLQHAKSLMLPWYDVVMCRFLLISRNEEKNNRRRRIKLYENENKRVDYWQKECVKIRPPWLFLFSSTKYVWFSKALFWLVRMHFPFYFDNSKACIGDILSFGLKIMQKN